MSQGFDLKVHHREVKTGRVVKVTPYQMKVDKENGTTFVRGGVTYFPDGTVKHDPKAEKKEAKK